MSTKVVTGKVRLSYCHLFEAQEPISGGDPKYGVTVLIPKSDTATMAKISAAIKEAADNFRQRNGAASLPAKPNNPVHDGDGMKDNGDPYGDECKGCWVIGCSSKQRPVVVDAFRNEVTDPAEVYSGCFGRVAFNFYGYSNARKGVGCGLLSVQKLSDGDPLGGAMGSADDFDDGYVDPSAADDLDFLG